LKIKKLVIFLWCLILIICPCSAFAVTGNGDGGSGSGGGSSAGSAANCWYGEDGVRVTVIQLSSSNIMDGQIDVDSVNKLTGASASIVGQPIDLANRIHGDVQYSYVKKSKLQYIIKNEPPEFSRSQYTNFKPSIKLPKIISKGVKTISATKKYFCSSNVIKMISSYTGVPYNSLTTDSTYMLLIEPIIYVRFGGKMWAMTATEAAYVDEASGGLLRKKFPTAIYKTLAKSMYLQWDSLGFNKPSMGLLNSIPTDSQIKNNLGMMLVSTTSKSTPIPPDENHKDGGSISGNNYSYRANTDVITAVTLSSFSEHGKNNPITVIFNIGGNSIPVGGIVLPSGGSQRIWVKWHTPNANQDIPIHVSASNTGDTLDITAYVRKIIQYTPPNPRINDKRAPDHSFVVPDLPNFISQNTSTSWNTWDCYWVPVWVWISNWVLVGDGDNYYYVDYGHWEDHGYWKFYTINHGMSLHLDDFSIFPDSKVPTAKGKKMGSGYGVDIKVKPKVWLDNVNSSDYTEAQNVEVRFPEFNYVRYNRYLVRTAATYYDYFEFMINKYSGYHKRVHFTPFWYPDGKYTLFFHTFDVWTPNGMLTINGSDYVNINGNVFDDWYVAPGKASLKLK
jgi:hypothetical protein